MYLLNVTYGDGTHARESVQAPSAEDVLELIPRLLARHGDCDRIEVVRNATALFAVSCASNPPERGGPKES